MLEEKKRRWDNRPSNGNEEAWILVGAIMGATIGLALMFFS